MNHQLKNCIYKDIKEYIRKRKNVVFALIILIICAGVFCTTLYFPSLIDPLVQKAPDVISDSNSLKEMLGNLFPRDMVGNMGILSSDIAVFYSLAIVLMVQGIIPEEIRTGRWIIPLGAGYKRENLILSKALVYGAGASLPVFAFYNLYFLLSSGLMDANYDFKAALLNSLLLTFSIFAITVFTIFASVISKHSLLSAVSILMVIMVAPDILSFFTFGKILPTHLLTHTYMSSSTTNDLFLPITVTVFGMIAAYVVAVIKSKKIEVNR